MTARFFVDTNILVYAYDYAEPAKQIRAQRLLAALETRGAGVISTQVLAEFFVTVTRRIPDPLTAAEGYARIENYLRAWTVLDMTGLTILEAVRGVRDHQLSFWDAQIWATARLAQVGIILSEDFTPGAVVEGIRFLNPVAVDFDLTAWIEN
jgi:predicted nucleic acid-binding protein